MAAYAQAATGGRRHGRYLPADSRPLLTGWTGPLTTIATELFGALAVISFVFAVGCTYLNGDGIDLGVFARHTSGW